MIKKFIQTKRKECSEISKIPHPVEFEKDQDEEIISVIPTAYYLDSKVMHALPLGQKSSSLKAEALIITTKKNLLYSYITAVEKAGFEVLDITIDAYACAKESFDAVYLQEGAVLIDIGYKTTGISFCEDGYLKFLTNIPMGGQYLTKKLTLMLTISILELHTEQILVWVLALKILYLQLMKLMKQVRFLFKNLLNTWALKLDKN